MSGQQMPNPPAGGPPPPPPGGSTSSAPPQPSALNSMVASMSQWELFVIIGALVLVLGDLVFGIVLRDFYAGDLTWLAAAVALVAFFANRRTAGSVPMYGNLMLLAAAAIALVGARDLVIEVLYVLRTLNNVDATYLIGFVIWAIGLALVAWGGWLLWRSRSA
jgi:hypothetical protein